MVSNSGISFSGLGSGLDTNAIVSQLMAVERIPINALQGRKGTEQRRLDLVGQLGDLVKTLQEKAEDLSSPAEFYAYAASISDESVAAVTAGSTAEPGSHSLDVQRLAGTDRWAFDAVSARDVDLTDTAGQQVSFSVGTTNYSLTVDPEASTLDEIASQINQMAPDDVSASVVNTGTESNPSYQLVLTSEKSGEEGRITDLFSDISGASESLAVTWASPDLNGESQSANNVTVGNDALATINGLQVRRSDNTFTGVIEGVTLDLRSTTRERPAVSSSGTRCSATSGEASSARSSTWTSTPWRTIRRATARCRLSGSIRPRTARSRLIRLSSTRSSRATSSP